MKETNPEDICINIALTYPKYHDDLFDIINSHEYFEGYEARELIKACLSIREAGKIPDLVSIAKESKVESKLIVSYTQVDFYYDWQNAALSVRERWMYRKFKEACARGLDQDYDDIFDLLTSHSETVSAIVSSIDTMKQERLEDTVREAIDQIAKIQGGEITGTPSGINKLDSHTRGFQPTDLIVVAARPGMGKTAFALCVTAEAQKAGKVLFFTIEMSAVQLVKRMYTLDERIDMNDIFSVGPSDELWPVITEVSDRISAMNIQIFDQIVHIEDIAAKVTSIAKREKVSLVVIDYLGLCQTREKVQEGEQKTAKISWKSKMIAKRCNVPVLLLSQLSREVEKRPTKRPQMADLRYSGAIEQDADMVIFPWWSGKYEMVDENGEYYGLFDIAKYRNGEPVVISGLEFEGKHMRWKDAGAIYVPEKKAGDLPF